MSGQIALQEKPKQTKTILIYGQKGQTFTYPTKILKIAIVGARSSKWTKEQEVKVKGIISYILENLKHNLITTFDQPTRDLTITKDIHDRPIIGNPEIIVISGHCPIGEKRWYDLTFNDYIPTHLTDALSWAKEEEHQLIKVYDQGGVDTWVEIICAKLGIKTEIYPAPAKQWDDQIFIDNITRFEYPKKGYRSRNIQIAEACDILYDLEPKGSCRWCGGKGYHMQSPKPSQRYFKKNKKMCWACEGDGSYSGGTWTLKEARKRGKEVHKVIIE